MRVCAGSCDSALRGCAHGDGVTPEELVEAHLALAHQCAQRQWWRGGEEWDDVHSDALLGLWDAARRYDPERGATFATFAWPRMVGAIGDGRRERDFVPRSARKRGAVERPVSLDDVPADGDGLSLADRLADPADGIAAYDDADDRWSTHVLIASLLRELPADDRYVISRLLDGATLAQIGVELGFTESRACQIHRRALGRMRQVYAEVA